MTGACFFGTYERQHSANRLLRQALVGAGLAVEEIHQPLWESTRSKDARYFRVGSLARLGLRWAGIARDLRRRWRTRAGPPPLVVIGFGGPLDLLLAARVCRPRRGLVFAPLVSLTETLVEDRHVFAAGSLRARLTTALDRRTFRLADLVLADTAAHAAYLAELGAPADRVAVWPLGVEPEFLATSPATPEPGRVLFYGSHVPLHGVETIVAAAALLGDRARIRMIGTGPGRVAAEAQARALGAAISWIDDVPLSALPMELARAAVVLGVFSPARKAAMVVPNKVYQAAAAGRPLITRDGPGLREALIPDVHCLAIPPGDPAALAAAITRLVADPAAAERLGAAARHHVSAEFGLRSQADRLASLLRARFGGDVC